MRSHVFFAVLSATLLALALPAPEPAAAAKRKQGMGVGQCWIEGTVHPAGPGESISSCCLEDGCWICNATWNDCTWDPKMTNAGAGGIVGTKGGVKDAGPGTIRKLNVAPGATLKKQ